jgi:hypothetical protein
VTIAQNVRDVLHKVLTMRCLSLDVSHHGVSIFEFGRFYPTPHYISQAWICLLSMMSAYNICKCCLYVKNVGGGIWQQIEGGTVLPAACRWQSIGSCGGGK